MKALNAPLSGSETTALMQIALRARLAPEHSRLTARLFHLGLVGEGPEGLSLTEVGKQRYRIEAERMGLLKTA